MECGNEWRSVRIEETVDMSVIFEGLKYVTFDSDKTLTIQEFKNWPSWFESLKELNFANFWGGPKVKYLKNYRIKS